MDPVRISVITVAYNSAATIADTLASVAAQSHPWLEHIVIDGASTDATLAVVHQRGKHVSRVVSEPDHGIYDAMNKGLRIATGDYVGFLNADDMFEGPDCVARIARAASGGVDVVYGDLLYVEQHDPARAVRYWRSGAFLRSSLRFGWMAPHPTFYVRRERVAELGGFADDLSIAADYDFVLRHLGPLATTVAYVPQVLVRMRTGGVSNRSLRALLRKSREDLRALERNRIGGVLTLVAKNMRKLPQFVLRPRAAEKAFLRARF